MSIIFSCNYLKELEELILENKVDVDFIKYPSLKVDDKALERALKLRPVLFHGFAPCDYYMCSREFIKRLDVEHIRNMLKRTGSTYVSAHIGATLKQFPEFSIDDIEGSYEKLFNIAVQNIEYVKSNFNMPFAIENTVYSPKEIDIIKTVTEPRFINDLIRKTDTYFLFDTSHARQSAYNRGMSFEHYISGLPLDKLYEVHLSGITMEGDQIRARHTKMNDEDYKLLEYLLENTPVKVVTLEYGPMKSAKYEESNPIFKEELYEQITRVKEIIDKYR